MYPAIWGAGQLGTGWLSDHVGRKPLIVTGMLIHAIAGFVILPGSTWWVTERVLLGAGTAMVYPTFARGCKRRHQDPGASHMRRHPPVLTR